MENLINIENKNLANYIMFKLNKNYNRFTKQELNKITEIVIDYKDEDESSFVFLEELLKLQNIEIITIRNGYIFNDNYNIFLKLEHLKDITFEKCEFENADLMASLNLKSLSLINCNIGNYLFINTFENLEQLTIINGAIEIEKINKLRNLRYLQISYSNIIDNNKLDINTLNELYIDNINICNFAFLNKLDNLKKVSIDEEQYNRNKILFDNLMKKNILVVNENMFEFGGENDEI